MPAIVQELRLPVPPEPGANGTPRGPRIPWWRKGWYRLRTLAGKLSPRPQELVTLREEMMAAEIVQLRLALHGREQEIFRLKTEIEQHKSEILIRNKQLELMTDVHELDRARVQADMAVYSSVQADIEARRQQQRGV